MNSQIQAPAKTQRRKDKINLRLESVIAQDRRSLDPPPGLGFAPLRLCVKALIVALALALALLAGSVATTAQEVSDTIRIKTRVVFMDALVKDKRTGIPVSDLSAANFEVFDEGQSRPLSYFTREGQARKPLALVLILDLREDGAGRFLKSPEVLKAMLDELAKLSPEDEVAVMAMNIGEDEKRIWLTEFTHERAQIAAALARVPQFIGEPAATDNATKEDQQQQPQGNNSSLTIGRDPSGAEDSGQDKPAGKAENRPADKPKRDDVVSTEVIKGKNGAVITRTVHKDGSVDVKRVNKKGDVTIELGDIYDMSEAVREATRKAEQQRLNSQASVVWVSDGIAPIFFEDRDATQELLIRHNVIFNSLTVDLRTLFKFLMPIGKPIAGWMGISLYGSAKRLAQQSGGEAVRVNRVKDYGTGLSKIIGNLTARYSLGFALAEEEKDDGRLHNLEVRVKAADAKGKLRKLDVSSRRGYYMTEKVEKEATASRAQ